MRCNIKQHKPLTPYQQKKFEAQIGFKTFQYVLGLTAITLDTLGATKIQIQEVINNMLNQYECLVAKTITMDDIHSYLEEYGISVEGGTLYSSRTEYNEQMDMLKLEGIK